MAAHRFYAGLGDHSTTASRIDCCGGPSDTEMIVEAFADTASSAPASTSSVSDNMSTSASDCYCCSNSRLASWASLASESSSNPCSMQWPFLAECLS